MKAWIENENIFVGLSEIAPKDAIDVPDNITPQDLKIENGKLVFKSENEKVEEIINEIKKEAFSIYKKIIKEVLNEYGYINLGDVRIYASLRNKEAKNLLNWYLQFDETFWNWIDKELPNKCYKELLEIRLNLYNIIKSFIT